jgi:primosomal protein N'
MFRVRGRHRRRILVRSGRRADAVAAVGDVVERLASERGLRDVAVGVDVDPQ